MRVTITRQVFGAMAAVTLCALLSTIAQAQERDRGTVAISPVVFKHNTGTETSHKTAIRSVEEVLQRAGFTVLPYSESEHTWSRMSMPMVTEEVPARRHDLVRFGQAMHARYVVSPVFSFHSRSIWVDLGPRTDSTATVDVSVTDVSLGRAIFTRQNVSARSDEKFDAAKAGADLLLTPLVTIVSGGPKTLTSSVLFKSQSSEPCGTGFAQPTAVTICSREPQIGPRITEAKRQYQISSGMAGERYPRSLFA